MFDCAPSDPAVGVRDRGSERGGAGGGRGITLAPRLVEDDDLVDELDGLEAAALRVADELGVAALAEEVDVEHLRARRRIGVGAAAGRNGVFFFFFFEKKAQEGRNGFDAKFL